jgi:hypothetical protein
MGYFDFQKAHNDFVCVTLLRAKGWRPPSLPRGIQGLVPAKHASVSVNRSQVR